MKHLIFLLYLLISVQLSAQISGQAFLNNQSDHSNIKVRFVPYSPTASLDSAYSNASGSYSISIDPGIYSISFSKPGYQDVYYDNGNLQVLTGSETLNAITLNQGITEYLSGNISDTLYDSITYIITGNIVLNSGYSLVIEPGTQIKFDGNYNFDVYGKLTCIGEYNSPVVFSSNSTTPTAGDWGYINIYGTSDPAIITNSIIEYGHIYCERDYTSFTYNILRNFTGRGFEANGASPYIANNKIYNFSDESIFGTGIIVQFSNSIIECNTVFDGTMRGICLWGGSPIARNNKVYNINLGSLGAGICTGGPLCDALVFNNEIFNCLSGIYAEDWYSEPNESHPSFVNNTIYNNNVGIHFPETAYGRGTILMNIVYDNEYGIHASTNNKPDEIQYNLFYLNTTADFYGVDILGIGQILTVNNNGDNIDAYYNLYQDPEFDTGIMPALLATSPAIDAGASGYFDNDSTIRDIGANFILLQCGDSTLSFIETQTNSEINALIFPNPASKFLTIELFEEYNTLETSIYTPYGQLMIHDFNNENCSAILEIESLPAGMYILKLTTDSKSKSFPFIKID